MIKHIWFDFSETIASISKEAHDNLRYKTYAEMVGKPLTPELIAEYEELYKKHSKSNSTIFHAIGAPQGFWAKVVNGVDPATHYGLMSVDIPETLEEISKLIPISIFSNVNVVKILPAVEVNPKLFTHILSSGILSKPKPHLDGFYKVIELSGLKPEEILYIGDDIGKDVRPAKKVGIKAGVVFMESPEADYSFADFRAILKFVRENK